MQVLVRDNNLDQAIKVFRKKVQRDGILRDVRIRICYEKPSEKRAREKAEAVRRVRKLARKREQRELHFSRGAAPVFPHRSPSPSNRF